MRRKIINEIPLSLLIFLWMYAALSKLAFFNEFRFQLLGHQVLVKYAGTLAWLVPAIEIAITLLLLADKFRKAGLYASIVLLSFFSIYILYMFNYYPHRPCSCGGIISKLSWKQHLWFNMAFIALSIAGLYLRRKAIKQEQGTFRKKLVSI